MKGKHALASSRRRVTRLEEENDKLLTKVKELEAQLRAAEKVSRDRGVLAKTVESLREQRDNATSEELVRAKRKANRAVKKKNEAQAERALIEKNYHKLCNHYIAQAGGGAEGVDALAKLITGSDAIVSFYTEQFKEGESKVGSLVERVRRRKAEAFANMAIKYGPKAKRR